CHAGCTYEELDKILGDNRRYVVDLEPGDDPNDGDAEADEEVHTGGAGSRPDLYLVGGSTKPRRKKATRMDPEQLVQVREHVLNQVELLEDLAKADPDSSKGKRLRKMVRYAAGRHGAPNDVD